jgi:glutamine amidotransferase
VLPGIGAFDKAMRTLRERDLVAPLNEAVLGRGAPVLGVCLGMQLLARTSEEGVEPGLAWIAADVRRIAVPTGSGLKVPHIGWAETRALRASTLFAGMLPEERYYFDHSYHMVCDRAEDAAAAIDYGSRLVCAVEAGHVMGVQFHPEKSHRFGMRLLTAFAEATFAGVTGDGCATAGAAT